MKIALIGYGKMGHAIRRIAIGRGHTITCTIDADTPRDIDTPAFTQADVAIEFTTPATALGNIINAIDRHIPVVSGTTGWTRDLPQAISHCHTHNGTLMWSSNYSIGVNIFNHISRQLAAIMGRLPQYTPAINEVHHIHKLDHPSGTAITLADNIISAHPALTGWTEDPNPAPGRLPITHQRQGEVPGIHTITWDSPVDTITLTHSAKSRDGFALGAVIAAEWLHDKTGYHTIDQLIDDLISRPS